MTLPQTSVRYLKNGPGGQWWRAALEQSQAHLGWNYLPADQILDPGDFRAIEELIRTRYTRPATATRELNELRTLLEESHQHVWVTFEDGYLWWCTLRTDATVNESSTDNTTGHFSFQCERPWSNTSLGGRRLAIQDLPGTITKTSGYRGTVCEADPAILRLIHDTPNPVVEASRTARLGYANALSAAVRELNPKDFEQLVDHVLFRAGWSRVSVLGKNVEGIDLEVENVAVNEIAFVQVKCEAGQAELDDYVARFRARRDRYARMIFVVHSPRTHLNVTDHHSVQVWDGDEVARLALRLGLGDWVESRLV